MQLKKKGRRRTNEKALAKILEAGKTGVVIKRREWKLAEECGKWILRKRLGLEFEVRGLADDSGWFVKQLPLRVKSSHA